MDQAGAEQDTKRQDTSTAEGSERPAQDTRQDQEAAPQPASPNAGRPAPGGSQKNQEQRSPIYPIPWGLWAHYNRQGSTVSEGSLTGYGSQNKMLLKDNNTSSTSGPADLMTTEDPQAPEGPQSPGQHLPKEL